MERLTKCDTDGQAMMDCENCKADWMGKHGKPMVDCTALYCRNRLKDRLAAYEDTGLTPGEVYSMSGEWSAMMSVLNSIGGGYDRLRELAEADKEGRVMVRCKECKYSYADLDGLCCAYGVCVDSNVPEDFYCANGERRGGAEC